jgi:putative intracellular protease/amidase
MKMSIFLFDGFTALDIVGGYDVLARIPDMEVEFFSARKQVVADDLRSLGMIAYRDFSEMTGTDILYVPGGPGVSKAMKDEAALASIRALHETTTWTVGICNGVETLGAAGLLAGKTVTTNWACRQRVAAFGATVKPLRYCCDGKLVTGAGVSASIDAALFLAGEIGGEHLAKTIQLGIEYYPDPPFGNGTPDTAPADIQAAIQFFEANPASHLEKRQPKF